MQDTTVKYINALLIIMLFIESKKVYNLLFMKSIYYICKNF